jgi:ribosomal protein S18 acetylase RimI-like enzyme
MPPPLRAAAGLGVTYRTMTEADLPFVAELYASTRREEVAQTGWPREVREAFLAQQHRAQHSDYSRNYADAEWLIVEHGGEPVGRLYWRERPGAFEVIDISLLPAARGRGIGGAILRDGLEQARAAGKPVTIYVEKMNRARRLYERLGFAVAEDQGIYDLMRCRP